MWLGPNSGIMSKWAGTTLESWTLRGACVVRAAFRCQGNVGVFPTQKTADFSVSERETGVVWPEVWVSMRLDALDARNVDFKVRERV